MGETQGNMQPAVANLLCSDQYAPGDYTCRLRHSWGGLPATRREKCLHSIVHSGCSTCLAHSKANLGIVSNFVTVAADKQQFEREMVCMIENHRSFPCIVQWVVFNEGWGQYEVSRPGTPPKGYPPLPPRPPKWHHLLHVGKFLYNVHEILQTPLDTATTAVKVAVSLIAGTYDDATCAAAHAACAVAHAACACLSWLTFCRLRGSRS